VPNRFRIILLDQAKDDITSIARFIEERSFDRETALIWIDSVMDAIMTLEVFPNSHPRFKYSPFRKMIHGDYLIFYEVDDENDEVCVTRIVHAKRLIE
jgi:plasmid stabilization system protein ParE